AAWLGARRTHRRAGERTEGAGGPLFLASLTDVLVLAPDEARQKRASEVLYGPSISANRSAVPHAEQCRLRVDCRHLAAAKRTPSLDFRQSGGGAARGAGL